MNKNQIIKISVPATSANLGPGFDTLGLSLNIFNHITIKRAVGKDNIKYISNNEYIDIFSEDSKISDFEVTSNNYFLYILRNELKFYKHNLHNLFFDITVDINIPISRGLGSSAAVITTAVLAALLINEKKFNKKVILNKSLFYEKHPDNITPAIYGGFTLSLLKSHTNILYQKIPVEDVKLKVLLIIPDKKMSTKESRKKLPYKISMKKAIFNLSHASMLTYAFMSQNWRLLKEATQDKIHQDIRLSTMPELIDLQQLALNNYAYSCTLSGSGSTLLVLADESNIKKIEEEVLSEQPHYNTVITEIDNQGLKWNVEYMDGNI